MKAFASFALVAALLLAGPSLAQQPALSPAGQAAIESYRAQIARERAALAALPPATTVAEKLVRIGRLDQSARRPSVTQIRRAASPQDLPVLTELLYAEAAKVNADTQADLLAVAPAQGWFSISEVGPEAAHAAFLALQHSDLATQQRFLPAIEPLAAKGEIAAQDFMMLYDRVAANSRGKQRYGTQVRCENGFETPFPYEEPEKTDAYRVALGLPSLANVIVEREPPIRC